MTKTIFICFDFGLRGDFEGLYQWLDEKEAQERGYGIAVIKNYSVEAQIKTDLDFLNAVKLELSKVLKIGNSDRIYLIWNSFEGNKIKSGFLYGKGKQSPWTGFAQKVGESLDLDV